MTSVAFQMRNTISAPHRTAWDTIQANQTEIQPVRLSMPFELAKMCVSPRSHGGPQLPSTSEPGDDENMKADKTLATSNQVWPGPRTTILATFRPSAPYSALGAYQIRSGGRRYGGGVAR
jgi:hypothetical protein